MLCPAITQNRATLSWFVKAVFRSSLYPKACHAERKLTRKRCLKSKDLLFLDIAQRSKAKAGLSSRSDQDDMEFQYSPIHLLHTHPTMIHVPKTRSTPDLVDDSQAYVVASRTYIGDAFACRQIVQT